MNRELLWFVSERIVPDAFSLLPARMNSPEAHAMLLAIGLQESDFHHRIQVNGPAHSFWQFERNGGIRGVLTHEGTGAIAHQICDLLIVEPVALNVYTAIAYHDVLAAVFARLLLWTDPRNMPGPAEAAKGWDIYLAQWRPGKPRPNDWKKNFEAAWATIRS
jgi:hypothetical protein